MPKDWSSALDILSTGQEPCFYSTNGLVFPPLSPNPDASWYLCRTRASGIAITAALNEPLWLLQPYDRELVTRQEQRWAIQVYVPGESAASVTVLVTRDWRNKGMCCHFLRHWLPSLSVHGCAHLWLLLTDVTAHHSFQFFFSENVIGDSIALRAGDKNEQDRQGAYSQGTLSLLETALNKYSSWLIIRIYRFCKNKVWGEIPQLISFRIIKVIFYKRHEGMLWRHEQ